MTLTTNDLFESRRHHGATGDELPYRLLKPAEYETDGDRDWPLILFLHGAGERGGDNQAQLNHFGPAIASEAMRAQYPCFVALPQAPEGTSWALLQQIDSRVLAYHTPTRPLRMAFDILNDLQREFRIDRRRIYLTGLSMGGFGAWDALWRWPGRFAAVVPVCGGGDPSKAPLFATVPLWAFHGTRDRIVPVEATRLMIEALRQAGGQPRYTEYPEVGHNSWTPAYHDAELYAWLFAQQLA